MLSYASRYKDLELVDLDPKQADTRDHIVEVCKDRCFAHGGAEVGTPALMESSMKNMYPDGVVVRVKDDFLRCCLTVPLMVLCARKNIKQGKLLQCGESYRIKNEKLQILLQLDFDILGEFSPMLPEAECVRLISEVSKRLNLEHVRFRVNHCGLLICILQVCGILDEPTQRKVWKILADHSNLEEPNPAQLSDELITAGMDGGSVARLLKYLRMKGSLNFLDEMEKDEDLLKLPDTKKIIEQLRCFLKYCTIFRVHFEVSFDINLVREFNYYTGLMLECICGDSGVPTVIACGGRYDRLASRVKEGFDVQCMGFTFCTEALRDLYIPLSVEETSSSNPGIMVGPPFPHYSFSEDEIGKMVCQPLNHLVLHGDTTEEVVFNGKEDEHKPPLKDSTVEEEGVRILYSDTEETVKIVDKYTQESHEYILPLQEKGPT